MEGKKARILSKNEIQQTLSAANSKKKKQKGVRNILALPFDQFWPEVTEIDAEKINTLLEKLLPEAKKVYEKPAWKDICNLSREERKNLRQAKKNVLSTPEYRKYLLAGHRSVSRAVEQDTACCCILSKDVEPQFMLSSIVTTCQHNNIPVIAIPSLHEISRKTLNFPATALAFKKSVSESTNNKFYPIYKTVCELSNKLLDLHKSKSNEKLNNLKEGKHILQTEGNTKYLANSDRHKPYKYLYLKTDGSRAFIPEREVEKHRSTNVPQLSNLDFLSLSISSNEKTKLYKKESDIPKHDVIDTDDDEDDEDMDIDNMFEVDKKPSDITKGENDEEITAEPKVKKVKRPNIRPLLNPQYFSVKIKTVTNNPAKASKRKKNK